MALLSLRDVRLAFGGPELFNGVSLQMERRERVCLVGRNGAGKSTVMNIISGDSKPDAGEVINEQGLRIRDIAEISYEEPPSESPRELDAAREPEAAAAAASGVVEDADATALRTPTSQMRILTKFRGAGAEPSPIDVDDPVNGEARPEIGRVPVESLSADRDRKPKLLARLLGSF